MSNSKTQVVRVKAGKYFVGDPCYLFPHHPTWMELLESCDYFNQPEGTVHGETVVASRTQYGDGRYESSIGVSFGVDAGLIGIVPEALGLKCLKEGGIEKPYGVELVEFKEDFDFKTVDSEGTIRIGHITIFTGDEEEEEDYDYYDDDEDDN